MAKLNNIEMKAFKTFLDHDGAQIAQATLYSNGKKIGFWSQDSWGGPDSYDNSCYDLVKESAKKLKAGCPNAKDPYNVMDEPDVFMGYLLQLAEDEKEYKKCQKKGFKTLVMVSDGFHMSGMYYRDKMSLSEVEKNFPDDLPNMKKGMFEGKDPVVKVYTSAEDFNVTVDETHPALDWMGR